MFGLGIPELIIIFVIALLVFGPKKLPDLGKSIGRAMAEFKKASDEFQDTVRSEMKEVEKSADVDGVRKLASIDLPDPYDASPVSAAESGSPEQKQDHKQELEADQKAGEARE